jgi:hypothetical protein
MQQHLKLQPAAAAAAQHKSAAVGSCGAPVDRPPAQECCVRYARALCVLAPGKLAVTHT